jgi:EAL domain-containing protein (putative c-di-GMP-specific phosphodiesterase class I)
MDTSREHRDVLLRLRRAGFRIAIDDFGAGYSSLDQQLQRVKSCGGGDVQGYYFSKPVGADAMTALLRKGRIVRCFPATLLEALVG